MLSLKDKKFLGKYINSAYLRDDIIQGLVQKFYNERHVKHCVLPNFLKKELILGVLQDIEDGYTGNYMDDYTDIPGYKKGTGEYIKGRHLARLWDLFYSKHFFRYMELYLGSGVYSPRSLSKMIEYFTKRIWGVNGILLQVYNEQDYLTWHTDGPVSEISGSYVINLNKDWNKDNGGALQFGYKAFSQSNPIAYKEVFPQCNTLVIIKCEQDVSWHRVDTVKNATRITFHDQLFYK